MSRPRTKSGDPLENLKASDFTVTEDGKPQQIKVFEFQRLEDAVTAGGGRRATTQPPAPR